SQHDQCKLKLYGNVDSLALNAFVHYGRKTHGHDHGGGEGQHVHDAQEAPQPQAYSHDEAQRVESLNPVVRVKLRAAEEASGGVVMVEEPGNQGQKRREPNSDTQNPGLEIFFARGINLPQGECQWRDGRRFLAQYSEGERDLAGPNAAVDGHSDTPQGEGRSG